MQLLAVDPFDLPLLARIHQITLPTPFPVGPVHTYLLEGEPLTLIDTGPQTVEAMEALQAGLAALGYGISDLERVIVTHAHSDHFGMAGTLREASNAPVWAHPLARSAIEGWAEFHAHRDPFWYDLLLASGVPVTQAERSAQLYRSFRHLQRNTPVSQLLADGSTVEMAGVPWQVLHCPGHSSSLICFHQSESRLLIGNDHLLAHISSNAIVEPPSPGQEQRPRPLIDYWQSLCRVYDLDLDLVLTGHGDAVISPRLLIGDRFRFYERRLERLRVELRSRPRTVWQLAEALFRRLDAVDTFLAASEIIGHLDVLEDQGEVIAHKESHQPWRYELVERNS